MAWWDGKLPAELPVDGPLPGDNAVFPLANPTGRFYVPKYYTIAEIQARAAKQGRSWELEGVTFPVFGLPNCGGVIGYYRKAGGARSTAGYHCGVDLAAKQGDQVLACESGTILRFRKFYGDSYALFVDHGSCIINYGEVDKNSLVENTLFEGSTVDAGQCIALVALLPKKSSMLHFEMYTPALKGTWSSKAATGNQSWSIGAPPPSCLLNPTPYLLALAGVRGVGTTPIDNSVCR